MLARAARLPAGARALLDAVAIAPPRAELWLLEAIAAVELAFVEECLTSGMLRVHRDGIAFRHEIARVAIEEAMPPDRRPSFTRRALPRSQARPPAPTSPASHTTPRPPATSQPCSSSRPPPASARRDFGAHREAAAQFARALRFADGLPPEGAGATCSSAARTSAT